MRSILLNLASLIGSPFFGQFTNAAVMTLVAIIIAEKRGQPFGRRSSRSRHGDC